MFKITKLDAGMLANGASPVGEIFLEDDRGREGSVTVNLNSIRFWTGWIAIYGPAEGGGASKIGESERPIVEIYVWKEDGHMRVCMTSANGHVAHVELHWPKDRRPYANAAEAVANEVWSQQRLVETRVFRINDNGELVFVETGARFHDGISWWDLASLGAAYRKTRVDAFELGNGWKFSFLPERTVKEKGKPKHKPAVWQVFRQKDDATMEVWSCIRTGRGTLCWGPEEKPLKRSATVEERKAALTEVGNSGPRELITEADAAVAQMSLQDLFAAPDAGPTVVQ